MKKKDYLNKYSFVNKKVSAAFLSVVTLLTLLLPAKINKKSLSNEESEIETLSIDTEEIEEVSLENVEPVLTQELDSIPLQENSAIIEQVPVLYDIFEELNMIKNKINLYNTLNFKQDLVESYDYVPRLLTLEEKELVISYLYDLTSEEWKEIVCEMMAEAPNVGTNYEGMYEVASCVYNRYISSRWNRKNGNPHDIIIAKGQFTTYKVGYWYQYFENLPEEEFKSLPAYQAAIDCFYSQKPIHNFTQFRSNGSSIGILLSPRGNRFLDPLSDSEIKPLEERGTFVKMLDALNNKENKLYPLFLIIQEGDIDSLDYYYANIELYENNLEEVEENTGLIKVPIK